MGFAYPSPLPGSIWPWWTAVPVSPPDPPPHPTWLFCSLHVRCLFPPLSTGTCCSSAWNTPPLPASSQYSPSGSLGAQLRKIFPDHLFPLWSPGETPAALSPSQYLVLPSQQWGFNEFLFIGWRQL